MKSILNSKPFKLALGIVAALLLGALIATANTSGKTLQSSVVGTVFAPAHYVAQKIANGLDNAFGTIKGNKIYEKEIDSLQNQLGELQSQLVDYENLKKQNELYKDFLGLKEENPSYEFVEASIIARDSADVYKSFTISKGSLNGVKQGDAVLYGKYLVGIISKAYPDYSVVQTTLDAGFNISAYELLTGEISYVTGNATLAKDNRCKMANLDASTKISYESIVCTAGIGGNVPKDLIIGTVDEIKEEQTDISSYAVVKPGVDATKINQCFVLTKF